jgi:glycosyl transferase family 2
MKPPGEARPQRVRHPRTSGTYTHSSLAISTVDQHSSDQPSSNLFDREPARTGQQPFPATGPFGLGDGSGLGKTLETALLRRVSVVIPTLNEVESITHVVAAIPAAVREIIVVDGLSTDGTANAALAARPDVRVVHQQAPGKGAAIRAGVHAASGDYIVLMDGDGSTDPAYIATFARVLAGGADYAKASRFLPGAGTDDMPFHRRVGNWLFVQLSRILFGTGFTDITYGYNAVRRDHLEAMALEIDGWAQEIVTNLRMVRYGMRVEEIAAFERRRIGGAAKLRTWSAGWAILCAIVAERGRSLPPLQGISLSSLGASSRAPVPVMADGRGEAEAWLQQVSDETEAQIV